MSREPTERAPRSADPTPSEIRKQCQRIQAKWSDREMARRAGLPPATAWLPPTIPVADLNSGGGEVNESIS